MNKTPQDAPFGVPPCYPTGIEASVCLDIAARQQMGIAKYGTTVAENPLPLRAWLQHAYEESLDLSIYLKRAIEEMDNSMLVSKNEEYDADSRGTLQK